MRGIMEKTKNKIFQGGLLDPLTAPILTIEENTPKWSIKFVHGKKNAIARL